MSNGTTKSIVYHVEVRTSFDQPQEIAGMLLGQNWAPLSISQYPSGLGVPNVTIDSAGKHGYFTYEAAQALRWWFHAEARYSFCLQSRLVAFDWEESWSATRKSEETPQPQPRRPWDDFIPYVKPEKPVS